jgi:hypothetical protein
VVTVTDFQAGEIVNVTIKGVRYVGADEGIGYGIETPDGSGYSMPWSAILERAAPAEWPPQPGDVWADRNDGEWFARQYSSGTGILLIGAEGGLADDADKVRTEFGPLALVRRRGRTPRPDGGKTRAEPDRPVRRATLVAGLRAFADTLEIRTDLPTPMSVGAQIGFKGQDRVAEAERLAASFDAELGAPYDTGHPEQRWARSGKVDFGGGVTLTLYAHGLDAPEGEAAPDGAVSS